MYDPERWAAFLSGAMADAGIAGPADLCRRAGISHSVFSRWISDCRQPGNRALSKLAPVLGVSVRTLLVESGHFSEDELIGGDDALTEILISRKLTDKQKLRLIGEWRRDERARERRFATFVERFLMRAGDAEESGSLS